MRVRMAQIDPTPGDIAGNTTLVADALAAAASDGTDLLLCPELVLSGYQAADLFFRQGFLDAVKAAAETLAAQTAGTGTVALVGAPWRTKGHAEGDRLHNAVLVLQDGKITGTYAKRLLPCYDVFDEPRYFQPGNTTLVIDVAGVKVGVAVCEDIWAGQDAGAKNRYRGLPDPVAETVAAGAQMLAVAAASPFAIGKDALQADVLCRAVSTHRIPVVVVNQAGANDGVIAAGRSRCWAPTPGNGAAQTAALNAFLPDAATIDPFHSTPCDDPTHGADEAGTVWHALVTGVRGYAKKTGLTRAALGISGGIDSAAAACIAAAALGADNVYGVTMPSRHSSQGSVTDAVALADSLGIHRLHAPIEPMHAAAEHAIVPMLQGIAATGTEATEENIQSRIRGMVVMAVANKGGMLAIATGNKAELAAGYCTLYGDMVGGLSVLGDLVKLRVYALAKWINANHAQAGFDAPPIPEASIDKPPSAELAPGQLDQDSLPPYDELDEIVTRRVQGEQSPATICAHTGFADETVRWVCRAIDTHEHKRRQGAIVLKVTAKAFATGRRYTVAQRWRDDA